MQNRGSCSTGKAQGRAKVNEEERDAEREEEEGEQNKINKHCSANKGKAQSHAATKESTA